MNLNNALIEVVINNEFNYSNAIPVVKNMSYIVDFCDDVFNKFMNLVNEEKIKNERLKYEFRNYLYQEHYGNRNKKGYETTSYKNYSSFINAINNNQINNISSLEIKLGLSFYRGKNNFSNIFIKNLIFL